MKYYETHFEDYLKQSDYYNIHPKLDHLYNKFPQDISDFKNTIFYGPSGVGKYTQVLRLLRKYSPTNLKYEKKISITYDKTPYYFKISDIHFEIDISLLGCNSKMLWNDIFIQLLDIITTYHNKTGIFVCKNFNNIHSELLQNFYSYIQNINYTAIDFKYILITEQISFIPNNILNSCITIPVPRPSKSVYEKSINTKIDKNIKTSSIYNIKDLHSNNYKLFDNHKHICDKIINLILNLDCLNFLQFRDILYELFIYNLDIPICIWYIVTELVTINKIKEKDISDVILKLYSFFKYYNNNYRPIYHLESYIFYLIRKIHGLSDSV